MVRQSYSPSSEPGGGRSTGIVYGIDMIEHASAINAVAEYAVDSYGADPTGVNFSDVAVAAAVAALGSGKGEILFGPGIYKLANPIGTFTRGQSISGAGRALTKIMYSGTGDCIRALDSRAYVDSPGILADTSGPGVSGRFERLTIDGTSAGTSATGLHIGDLSEVKVDIRIQNFTGASAIGIFVQNTVTWTERADIIADVANCTQCVVFDATAPGFPSFAYSWFRLALSCWPNQNGVVLQNNAQMHGVDMNIIGNFITDVTNTGSVLTIGTSAPDASFITDSRLSINVETDGATGLGHKTLTIGAAAYLQAMGVLNFFTGGAVAFQAGNVFRIGFTGRMNVDANLGKMSFWQGSRTFGVATGTQAFMSSAGAWSIDGGNVVFQQMTAGAQTITYDATTLATQAAQYDLFLKQPGSGSTTITWPASFVWADGGTPPVLSATPNDVDHIKVVTPDHVTFYAVHSNRWLDRITANISQINLNTSAAETTLVTNTLATGVLKAATTMRFTLRGTVQCQATSGILTFRVYMGANAAAQTFVMATQGSAAGPVPFFLQVDASVRTAGASGTYIAGGYGRIEFTTAALLTTTSASTAVVDTTAATPVIKATAQFATSSATNKLLVEVATIERIV